MSQVVLRGFALPRPRFAAGVVLHASVLLVAVAAIGRMLSASHPLCPVVITLSSLLTTGYVAGLASWERLGRLRPLWLGALLVVWSALVLLVPAHYAVSFGWLAVPLAIVTFRALPFGIAAGVVGAVSVALALHLWLRTGLHLDLVVAPVTAVLAAAALYVAQQREAAARQRLVDRLAATREELGIRQRQAGVLAERARIARDIHDTLAQELAGSRMLLQAAERDWVSDADSARRSVALATEALGENLTRARRMITDLRTAEFDEEDLAVALEAVCERERGYGYATVDFEVIGEPTALDRHGAVALLRTAQGALANVRDHAGATRVRVTLDWRRDQARLRVVDDGVGFDPARRATADDRGFGLDALRDRLALSLGTLEVRRAPGGGTVVQAGVPVLADGAAPATMAV